jgi:acyl-ACP thioesterase
MKEETIMEPVLEKRFLVRSYELDSRGWARPTLLLGYIQEASVEHARLLGISVRDLRPLGLTWVLSRMHLALYGTLSFNEELLVRTWPSTREGRFSCREFEFLAADGRMVGAATGSFAVLDVASRRPVDINERVPAYPLLPRRAIDDDFATLPSLDHAEAELSFRVGRREIDFNRHVNNVVYAEWALETVPEEIAERCRLLELEIAFRGEALYGDTVVARSSAMPDRSPATFLHQIARPGDGAELTRLISRWGDGPAGQR